MAMHRMQRTGLLASRYTIRPYCLPACGGSIAKGRAWHGCHGRSDRNCWHKPGCPNISIAVCGLQHHTLASQPASFRSQRLVKRVAEQESLTAGYDDDVPPLKSMTEIDRLNMEYGIPNMIMFTEGENGLPRVWMKHMDSEMGIEIYLHGATITQWLRPNGSSALDSHPSLKLEPDSSNKGAGLRLAFPVYRASTTMTLDDGFAGRLPWEVVAAGLTCMPQLDGTEGEGFQPIIDEYLKLQEENPEEYDVQIKDGADPLTESGFAIVTGEGEAEADGAEQQEDESKQEVTDQVEQPATTAAAPAEAEAPQAPVKPKRGRKPKTPSPPIQTQEQLESPQGLGMSDSEDETIGSLGFTEVEVEQKLEEALNQLSPATQALLERLEAGYDPAPFITLRLRDSEETRQIWPHKFELLYKITIMESDDMPELDVVSGAETLATSDSLAAVAADDMMNEEARADAAPPPVLDVVGRTDPDTGLEVPVQLKINLVVVNRDDPKEAHQPMMEFEVAALMQFAVEDIMRKGDAVKVLGLGHTTAVDYAHDPRMGLIMSMDEDYLHYPGTNRVDATFIGACRSDIKITPGDGTHYEFLPRQGFKDVSIFHPGVNPLGPYDPWRNLAGIGVGCMSVPRKLKPGEFWEAEFCIRWQNTYWQEPTFGDDAPLIPNIDPEAFTTESDASNIFADVTDDVSGTQNEGGEEAGAL